MKVTKAKATGQETSATIDLEVKNLSSKTKIEVGEFLLEQMLDSVSKRESPVTGKTFQGLSPKYKKFKKDAGLGTAANLEFSGDMLDALSYVETDKGIRIGVFGSEAKKADGHNNISGKSSLPPRTFIPKEGESFTNTIVKEVNAIISDSIAETSKPDMVKLKAVTSSASLFRLLAETFTSLQTKTELRGAVLRSPVWMKAVEKVELVKWL